MALRSSSTEPDQATVDDIGSRIAGAMRWLFARMLRRFPRQLLFVNTLDVAGYFISLLALALALSALSAQEDSSERTVWLVSVSLPGSGGSAIATAVMIITVGSVGAAFGYVAARLAINLSRDVQLDITSEAVEILEKPGVLGTLAELDDKPENFVAGLVMRDTRSVALLCTRAALLATPFLGIAAGTVLMVATAPLLVALFSPLFAVYGLAVLSAGRWGARQQITHREANEELSRRLKAAAGDFADGNSDALGQVTSDPSYGETMVAYQLRFFSMEKAEAAAAVFVVFGYGLLVIVADWSSVTDLSLTAVLAFAVGFRHFAAGVRKIASLITVAGRHGVELASLKETFDRMRESNRERSERPTWTVVSRGAQLRTGDRLSASNESVMVPLPADAVVWIISTCPQKTSSLNVLPSLVEEFLDPKPDLYRSLSTGTSSTPAATEVRVVGREQFEDQTDPGTLTLVVSRRPGPVLNASRCDAVLVEIDGEVVGVGDRDWLERSADLVRAALESSEGDRGSKEVDMAVFDEPIEDF